jgi:hypothetical protein
MENSLPVGLFHSARFGNNRSSGAFNPVRLKQGSKAMVFMSPRFNWVALPLCLLGGCTQSAGLSNSVPLETQVINFAKLRPGPNFITFTDFADGKLALVDGCFRLRKNLTSMAIIWPETAALVRKGKTIRIEDNAARWSAKIGDRIRLGGKSSDDISVVNVDNKAILGCTSPYFVASNVIRR